MDNRQISEEYAQIGQDLIDTEPSLKYIRESQATIVYLASELEKKSGGKIVCGECEKVPQKWKWSVPCDFTITIYGPNVERFTDEQMRILIFHELLHVCIMKDGNEERYSVNPHDIEDFNEIIDRFGLEWGQT